MKSVENMTLAKNFDMCPFDSHVRCLNEIIDWMPSPINKFLVSVFSDPSIATSFSILPGSKNHHHGVVGGLLKHSVQCCVKTGKEAKQHFSNMLTGIGATAALLHDIGKVRTHRPDGRKTKLGMYVQHEDLTLEILAPHLQILDREAPHAGMLLRRLLTIKAPHKSAHPLEILVKTSDWFSTAMDRHQTAFEDKPDDHYYAYLPEGLYLC